MVDPKQEQLLRIIEARGDIAGRFTDIRRIGPTGGGGYTSFVFSAMDQDTKGRVAIKVLKPATESYRKLSFEREGVVLGTLIGRPDVVQLIAPPARFVEHLKTSGGLPVDYEFDYFVVELAQGSVEDILVSNRFDLLERLDIFARMCRAVQRIHVLPMAHRDLKPANFLRFGRGVVKLSDFGTARPLGPGSLPIASRYSAPPGDIRYAPVEMLAGLHDREPDLAIPADFFALGAILFELLSETPLSAFLWDLAYASDVIRIMGAIDPSQRRVAFEGFIDVIADNHPLPSLGDVAPLVPRGVVRNLNELYRSMAALDFRQRLCSFNRVFRQLRICQIVVSNELIERARREENRRRRAIRQARPARLS